MLGRPDWKQREVKVGTLTPRELRMVAAVPRVVFWVVEARFKRDAHKIPIEPDRLLEVRHVQDERDEPSGIGHVGNLRCRPTSDWMATRYQSQDVSSAGSSVALLPAKPVYEGRSGLGATPRQAARAQPMRPFPPQAGPRAGASPPLRGASRPEP